MRSSASLQLDLPLVVLLEEPELPAGLAQIRGRDADEPDGAPIPGRLEQRRRLREDDGARVCRLRQGRLPGERGEVGITEFQPHRARLQIMAAQAGRHRIAEPQ